MWFSNWLRPNGKHDAAIPQDGFGQSLLDDARFIWRFQTCRQNTVAWRSPDDAERKHCDRHALFGRFGDETVAVGNADGRKWIVRERDWHGWPDPPRFVFFAIDADGSIWSARDFHEWPRAWAKPGVER